MRPIYGEGCVGGAAFETVGIGGNRRFALKLYHFGFVGIAIGQIVNADV